MFLSLVSEVLKCSGTLLLRAAFLNVGFEFWFSGLQFQICIHVFSLHLSFCHESILVACPPRSNPPSCPQLLSPPDPLLLHFPLKRPGSLEIAKEHRITRCNNIIFKFVLMMICAFILSFKIKNYPMLILNIQSFISLVL